MNSSKQPNDPGSINHTSWRTEPAPIPEEEITAVYEADVAIIGLGYAGLALYRTLAEEGLSVIVAETMPKEEWWTVGHDIAQINSKFGLEHGIKEVDPVEFFNNWQVQTQNKSNPYFAMLFAKKSGETVDWLLEPVSDRIKNGCRFTYYPDNEFTIHQLNNGYRYYNGTLQWWEDNQNGKGMRNHGEGLELKDVSWEVQAYVEKNFPNAKVLFDTKGRRLIKENGRIIGFEARQRDGKYVKVLGKKAVVLCGGDFANNVEMCNDLLPHIARTFTRKEKFIGIMGRNGSAIQMGVWAGGRLETDIGSMNFDSMVIPDYIPGPLWVNEDGLRFQNEAFAGPEINGFTLARGLRGNVISIYDSTYSTQILRGFPGHQAFDYSDPLAVARMMDNFAEARKLTPKGTRKGFYCAGTLEELAENMGMNETQKAGFLSTVEEYNKICENGIDTDYGKDPRFLNPVSRPPFYAHLTTPALGFSLVTVGGFVTTNGQQVVDEDYKPIPGLYASGNTCGRRFGSAYITPIPGMSIGMALTLGRQLGLELAGKVSKSLKS